jgi:chromosome segregation ATPase
MSEESDDRTASLMTPAKLAQLKVRPKQASSPGAWLDQLASDAGSGHVRRLVDLLQQLEARARERDWGAAAVAAQVLRETLKELDFSVVQPKGWLARATGRGKEASAGFVVQAQRIGRSGEDFADEVRTVQQQQTQANATAEQTLAECEVEVRAIEKIMDQGARWLQDMRGQIKAREAAGGDEAARQQVAEDTARCELMVSRLKQLRTVVTSAQQATERCKAAAGRRDGLIATLQGLLEKELKSWHQQITPVTQQAAATGAASEGVERAREAQQELRSALKQAAEGVARLQAQEEALADELAGLRQPLQAAA